MKENRELDRQYDGDLLFRVSRKDEAAFAELYDRFSPGLYSLAVQILSDAKEAEDIVQETFCQIWARAETYNPDRSQAFTWAVMILRHKAIDRLRSTRRSDRTLEKAYDMQEIPGMSTSSSHDSADLPVVKERRAEVHTALARLSEEYQKAISLSFFVGLTHEEIAERLKQPLGTIKARIRRGLLQLRDFFKEGL